MAPGSNLAGQLVRIIRILRMAELEPSVVGHPLPDNGYDAEGRAGQTVPATSAGRRARVPEEVLFTVQPITIIDVRGRKVDCRFGRHCAVRRPV